MPEDISRDLPSEKKEFEQREVKLAALGVLILSFTPHCNLA
jgi:hypothetical protein